MSDLWDDLKARGEKAIDDLCASEMPESQTLEFKSKSDPASAELSSDDKKNLGKSLSALSNAMGGVIIWGIAPGSKNDEVSAGTPEPIRELVRFADRVHGLVGQLITPPNQNVELLPIARADGSGFLAIRVGHSDARPHMSVARDHQRYYLRAGSITQPMVDFQVRDMLRIRTSPVLVVSACFVLGSSSGSGENTVELVLSVGNEGRVSARYVYLSVGQAHRGAWIEAHPFSRRETPTRIFFEASTLSLHPGQNIDAAKLILKVRKNDGGEARFNYRNYGQTRKCVDTDIKLECQVGCEDMPAIQAEFLIPAGAFEDAIDRVLAGERRVEVDPKHLSL